jgi:hypothetical protein
MELLLNKALDRRACRQELIFVKAVELAKIKTDMFNQKPSAATACCSIKRSNLSSHCNLQLSETR